MIGQPYFNANVAIAVAVMAFRPKKSAGMPVFIF